MVTPVDGNLVVNALDSVTLAVSVTGSDVDLEIVWSFDNTTITEADDSRYMFSDDRLSLTITGVQVSDGGTYTVTVTNIAGSDSAVFLVTVNGECT